MQHADDSSSDEDDTLQRCLSAPSAIVLRDRLVRQDGGSVLLRQVGTEPSLPNLFGRVDWTSPVLRAYLSRRYGGQRLWQVGKIMRRAHELHRTSNNKTTRIAESVVDGLGIAVKLASNSADFEPAEEVCGAPTCLGAFR
jgi:hypothetical protein